MKLEQIEKQTKELFDLMERQKKEKEDDYWNPKNSTAARMTRSGESSFPPGYNDEFSN